MDNFDTTKINIELRNKVDIAAPVLGRSYTVTHSDDTGDIFVTIGTDFAVDRFGPLNDQVLLRMECFNGQFQLNGLVCLDLPGSKFSIKQRSDIFSEKMYLALMSIRYADSYFYEKCCSRDTIPVYMHFYSKDPRYDRVHYFGEIGDYTINK